MARRKSDKETLLSEYKEAGDICRWYEKQTRTSVSIFLPFATALIGLIEGTAVSAPAAKFGFAAIGLATSLLVLNTIMRLQTYYIAYIHRAKAIKKELGMELYTSGWESVKCTKTVSNKWSFGMVVVLLGVYFVVAVGQHGKVFIR